MGPPFRTSQFSYLEIDRSREIMIFCGTTFSTFSKSDPILARVSAPRALATVKEKLNIEPFALCIGPGRCWKEEILKER